MIQNLLSYGTDAKKSQLTSQLYLRDLSGHYDDNDVKNGSNTSLYNRSLYFTESQTCDMEGPLLHDLFNLDRFMLNSVAINVKLYRSRPEFCLMTSEGSPLFEVYLEEVVLKICKLQVLPSIITAHAEKLKTTNAKYPFTRTEVRLISIPAGSLSFNYNNLFNGVRPTRVVIGFVDAEAAAGSYELNPFNFQHFNLSQIALKLNQVPVSGNIMQLNYNTPGRTILPAFISMFEVTNKWMKDTGNQLSRNDIAGGNALYCFDVEPNFIDEGSYLNLLKQGTCSLETVFQKPLKKATACVVYAEYPSYFEINLERGVILE
ncbi:Hypothetical predicted protein [Mytilus galloprovincialis]|uniref:Uncharacterized protein n=1 Tax=Mytilus galloprovincialis TaxID=29158 RepID=A0A8B6BR95_MYTGA|nr:Hypothetical predicted protein [Mytilus galloprovincialis]